MNPAENSTHLVAKLFEGIRFGTPKRVDAVTLVPLIRDGDDGPDALLLEEGIRAGHSRVAEVCETGVVNSIRVEHDGALPLLILDGELVLGAKQNRLFNTSFVVFPGASVVVPVSCVEQGRWRYGGSPQPARGKASRPEFMASEHTITGTIRSKKLSRVTRNTLTGRGYDADQRSVWRDVDEYLSKTQVRSATSAYADGYRVRASEVEKSLDALTPEPGQVGIAAIVGERVLGLDMFGSAKLYERAWRKVVRGVLAETHESSDREVDPRKLVATAIALLGSVKPTVRKVPGCGETIHATAGVVAMGAIAVKGTVYHTYVAQV